MRAPKPTYSYLAAAALALVTFATFYSLRYFGPQSAIRRFHLAAIRGDAEGLNKVTIEGGDNQSTQSLAYRVRQLAEGQPTWEMVRSARMGRFYMVGVEYRFPNGFATAGTWFVELWGGQWKVNCTATLTNGHAIGKPPEAGSRPVDGTGWR